MAIQAEKAKPEDFDEAVDFINYVFSFSHRPHNFPVMLPKIYLPGHFKDSIHYIIREQGKIKALVCAYPVDMVFNNKTQRTVLGGRGIGMVSVHPYCRSRGYMKILMTAALDDMRRDGMVFSCLGGQRQRYEYFGFTPAGTAYSFRCERANVIHTLGRQWKTSLSLKKVYADDVKLLDQIFSMHCAGNFRINRSRDKFFSVLTTWEAEVFSVFNGNFFLGYFIYRADKDCSRITELNINDYTRLPEVIGLILMRQEELGQNDFTVITAGPHEREKIAFLSDFAENYSQTHATQFAVLDFVRLADAFLSCSAVSGQTCSDTDSFIIKIEDTNSENGETIRLFGGKSSGGAEKTGEKPDIALSRREVVHFLFSPLAAQTFPVIHENKFLHSILPLPLFIANADEV